MQDELSNAMKDFQFEPNMTFKEAGQLEIKNKPEEFPNKDQKETLDIQTIEMKDENSFLGYEHEMVLEIGQLEIDKNLPRRSPRVIRKVPSNQDYIEMLEVIKDDDQKLPLSIEIFEGKGKGVVALQKILQVSKNSG